MTLGGSTTGNILIDSGSSQIILSDNTSLTGDLSVLAENEVRLYENDSTSYIGLKAPSSIAGDVTYTLPGTITNGYVLQTNGSGVLTWVDPAVVAGASIFWTQSNGALYPKNSTVDFLVGGQTTESAKFAVLNVNGTADPVATLSAVGGSGLGFVLNTNQGTLQTLWNQTLTLGGASTGDILLSENTTINGNSIVTGTSDLQGNIADSTGNLSLNDNTDITGNLDISGTLTSGTSNEFGVDATGNISTSGTTGLTFLSTGGIVLAGGTLSDGTDGVDINDDLDVSGSINLSTGNLAFSGAGNITLTGGTISDATDGVDIADDLEVSGSTTLGDAAGDTLTLTGTAVSIPNNLNIDSNTFFIDAASNRVGIGTTAPLEALDVVGNATVSGNLTLYGGDRSIGTTQ